MSKVPISICIIAKNEETHIKECLKRLRSYNFELIVADTGSMDHTREIAVQYADRVVDFAWVDDFSAARNYCAEYAANDHILVLDCDEYVEKCDMTSLVRLLRSYPKLIGALQIKSIVRRPDGLTSYVRENVPRFYNKRYFTYSKPVHEQIVSRTEDQTVPNQNFLLPIEVIHHGYALPPEQMRAKQKRNLHLLHHMLETEGESAYLYYQIGQSELVLENCEEAIAGYERGLSLATDCRPLYVHNMVEGLAKAYVMTGRPKDALNLMERYEPLCDSARFVFYHANVLMDNHEPLKALIKYVKATMMPDTDMLGDELLYCYEHIIELYHRFGENELSDVFRRKYEECLQMRVFTK